MKKLFFKFPLFLLLALSLHFQGSPTHDYSHRYQLPAAELGRSIAEIDKFSDERIFLELLRDFGEEVNNMWEVKESVQARQAFNRALENFIEDPKIHPNPMLQKGFSWSGHWSKTQVITPVPTPANTSGKRILDPISVPRINQHLGHSLDDPQNYLENRLGKAVMEQINRGQIDIEVYAGSAERFAVSGDVTSGSIREVPSLYSEWGIRKFLVHRKGKKPLLTFVIPPIKEYAEHYAYMFDLAGSKNTKVVVNQVDRRIMRANFKKGARSIMKEFDHPIDVVAMGYGDHIEEALLKSDGEYKILDQKIIKGAEGWVDAKILTLERKNGEILTMLSGGSNKTLWGEASEAMAEAFLEYNPKLFFFMGSAGAPFGTTDIYNVSVPQKFMIGKQELGIENVIYKNRSLAEGQIEDIRKSVRVIFGGTHGHTSSPAQQSISYVDSLGKLKINSIDVEQSLVARAVKIHNLKALQKKKYNHNHVLFGAINLITDKPRHSKSLGAHAHNLDNVDQGLKHISRLSILDIMFETVRQESEIGKVRHKSCQGLIFGLLPGL